MLAIIFTGALCIYFDGIFNILSPQDNLANLIATVGEVGKNITQQKPNILITISIGIIIYCMYRFLDLDILWIGMVVLIMPLTYHSTV